MPTGSPQAATGCFQSLAGRLSRVRVVGRRHENGVELRRAQRAAADQRRGGSSTRRGKPVPVSYRIAVQTTPLRGFWMQVRNQASTAAPRVARNENAVANQNPRCINLTLRQCPAL